MFSQSTQYAIAALAYLAEQPSDEVCGAHQIATAINTPLPYLWKVLRALAENSLVISCKGCAGGYRLARNPRNIGLDDILVSNVRLGYALGLHPHALGVRCEEAVSLASVLGRVSQTVGENDRCRSQAAELRQVIQVVRFSRAFDQPRSPYVTSTSDSEQRNTHHDPRTRSRKRAPTP